jgi:hypothetical protein
MSQRSRFPACLDEPTFRVYRQENKSCFETGLPEFVHNVNSVQNRHAEHLLAAGLSRNRLHRRFLPLAKLGHGILP